MKISFLRKIVLAAISSVAVFLMTGCPSSPAGSGTGVGHGPSATSSSDTSSTHGNGKSSDTLQPIRGNGNMTNSSSNDTNKPGTGHPPALTRKPDSLRIKKKL